MDGNPDPEGAALAFCRLGSYLPFIKINDCSTDGEAEPGRFTSHVGALVRKQGKDVLPHALRNTLASVFHLEVEAIVLLIVGHLDRSFFGIAHGIAEQMVDERPEQFNIDIDNQWCFTYIEIYLWFDFWLELFFQLFHLLFNVANLIVKFTVARLQI